MFSEKLKEYSNNKFQSREKVYEPIKEELEQGFAGCTEDEKVLMRFFYGTMPLRDAGEYPFERFLGYVKHAIWLRENVSWCRELPEDVFVHHVLYYRINSEDISDCRKLFYEELKDRIEGKTEEEAVLEVNYWCAEHATYESTDARTASPLTMLRCFKGRCGEESVFAVTALRSVGIPARQVYTPRWAHCDDNHAWVEVWLKGKWYFLGACEPEAVLNRGWFAGPASRALLVHCRTFGDYENEIHEEHIADEGIHVCNNITELYTDHYTLKIHVQDPEGTPVQGAKVSIEALNTAELSVVASLETDENGFCSVTLGYADFFISARWHRGFDAVCVSAWDQHEVTLTVREGKVAELATADVWMPFDLRVQGEDLSRVGKQTKEQAAQNAERVQKAGELLKERQEAAFDQTLAAAYPEAEEMLRIAGNNFGEIYAFLSKDDDPNRMAMLRRLSKKDYKDLKAEILEDHLVEKPEGLDQKIFEKYLLSPRVAFEELRPYRTYFREYFTEEQKEAFREHPEAIWKFVRENVRYYPQMDYRTICATPLGCLKLGVGSPEAQKVLFVSICRSLGIPARVNEIDFAPEYYADGVFYPVAPTDLDEDEEEGIIEKSASLKLTSEDAGKWGYFQNWTIARLEGTIYETLFFWQLPFTEDGLTLSLKPGYYRLLTTMRKPNGGQHLEMRSFELAEKEVKTIELHHYEMDVRELLVKKELPAAVLADADGNDVPVAELFKGKGGLLAFLGVGAEPTEHVLNELLEIQQKWRDTDAKTVFVLKSEKDLNNRTLKKTLEAIPAAEIYYGTDELLEAVAAAMQTDPERLPVLTAVDSEGTGIFACSGYNVGSVELIRQMF